jgi:threonine aldolase
MDFIDLRSDTVTHPTPEMREAMSKAVVGDDVLREDPTVNQLQELATKKLGKQAGLFVPSGTMGNLLAVMCHCGRGEEVIMGNLGHTFLFEGGGVSALGGVFAHLLPNQKDGTIALAEVEAGIRPDDIHQPPTRLLVLENTHNRCGGVALTAEYTRDAASLAHKHGMKLHIDGARIFNAAAALNVEADKLVEDADSVTFCLSKGLCAPVGSVLCGDEEFIQKARRLRKMLGGGMRQAGVLAAAGIIAIEKMSTRLTEDHLRAKALAEGLAQIPAIRFEMGLPQTNMVFPSLADDCKFSAADVAKKLSDKGIKIGVIGEKKFRMVTHYWIDDAAIEKTVAAMRQALR